MKEYTLKDWEKDGVLRLSTDLIYSNEIICKMREDMPPIWDRLGVFQMGEANSVSEDYELLYSTFIRTNPSGWLYYGDYTVITGGYMEELRK